MKFNPHKIIILFVENIYGYIARCPFSFVDVQNILSFSEDARQSLLEIAGVLPNRRYRNINMPNPVSENLSRAFLHAIFI